MALNYSVTCKNNIGANISSQLGASGTLEILTSGSVVLAVFPFNSTAGTTTGGVLTFSGFPKTVAASATGTAALARAKDSSGTVLFDGLTVAVTGGDLNFNSTAFTSGANVTVNSLAITIQ